MKETGIEWIGEIPEDWKVKRLKYMAEIKSGTSRDFIKEENKNLIPMHGANSLIGYTDDMNVKEKSILTGRVGTLGTFRIDKDIWASDNVLIINNFKNTDLEYLNYALKCLDVDSMSSKTSQPLITATKYLNSSLCYPPLSEQKAIADFLDKKTKNIDNIKETLTEQIEVLKNYKKSLIYEATTKGLNKDVKLKDSGIEWIGEIPENWEITKNKYLFDRKKDIVGSDWENNQLLSLTKNGIIKKDIEDTSGKQPESFGTYQYVEKSDLILCLFDIDISAVFNGLSDFDGMISPAYKRFNLKEDGDIRYFNYFFDFVFDNRKYKQYSTSLRYTLDNEEFGAIGIIKPPLSEQKAIADYLDKKVSSIDKIIESKQQQIEDIENYKKSLIYEYTTGKKRVNLH